MIAGTVFQAEIYAILAFAYEIHLQNRSEKYVSICSDSQAALKSLKAVRTMSPYVNNSGKRHWTTSLPSMFWGYIGSLGMLEFEEMRSPVSSQQVALVWVSWNL
jgi:hypothetical protein